MFNWKLRIQNWISFNVEKRLLLKFSVDQWECLLHPVSQSQPSLVSNSSSGQKFVFTRLCTLYNTIYGMFYYNSSHLSLLINDKAFPSPPRKENTESKKLLLLLSKTFWNYYKCMTYKWFWITLVLVLYKTPLVNVTFSPNLV